MRRAFDRPADSHRRRWLIASVAASAAGSTLAFAAGSPAGTDRRFVFVILRGGLDGLAAVPAVGDPGFTAARGALGRFAAPPLPLDGPFALHPNLVQLHAMYRGGELAVVHAVGLPYRERSHFDAQQVLESGGTRPFELDSGWLGRALGEQRGKGIAMATAVPLVLRGRGAAIDTWAPSTLPDPSADLVARLEKLYATDAVLATALDRAKALHLDAPLPALAMAAGDAGGLARGGFVVLAQRAAEFLAAPGGPQAAVLEVNGWDTHANQASPTGPLAASLRQLDAGLAALRDGLTPSGTWDRTVVVVATEFGREVAINGTQGTDHGTGGAAFVLGGAVRGGRVVADWPGLRPAERYQGRDLRITTDIRGVLKGVLGEHLQVASGTLNSAVFPGSEAVRPIGFLKA